MSNKSNLPLILSHRGIDYSSSPFLEESSLEAFQARISDGFGLEFDLVLLKCGEILVSHDRDSKRINPSIKPVNFELLSFDEIKKINGFTGTPIRLSTLLELILNSQVSLHALHLKHYWQNEKSIGILFEYLQRFPEIHQKIMIFDVKPKIALILKNLIPNISLAASVSHAYDKKRYNEAVGGTLISLEEFYQSKSLYDWAWLDEWDLADENGKTKILYTESVFDSLRKIQCKIALVTPELHATSPGLLGGEAHPDGKTEQVLFERIKKILKLSPDLICTDYPRKVKQLLNIPSFS